MSLILCYFLIKDVPWKDCLIYVGGGSEEIMAELAIREEVKDLKLYVKAGSKL